MERYDIIVIGSGLGGLAAAARLTQMGRRVLVLERNAEFGGAATVYRHGRLAIEASLHETDDLGIHDREHGMLHLMGVADRLQQVPIPEVCEVRSALLSSPFQLPAGFKAATAATEAAFPLHAKAVRRYFAAVEAIPRAMHALGDDSDHRLRELLGSVLDGDMWQLLKRIRSNTLDVFDELFGDAEAPKIALAASLAYLDDDPKRLWFPVFALVQASFLREGGRYFVGGSRALTQGLVEVVEAGGGRAIAQAEAVAIVLDEHGRASGVRFRNAAGVEEDAACRAVLGNAAPSVLAEMLPAPQRAAFTEPYRSLEPSISLFAMAFGVSRPPADFGVTAYSTFVMPDWMKRLDQFVENGPLLGSDPGDRVPYYVLVDYNRVATGLNEEGLHLMSVTGIDRLSHWEGMSSEQMKVRKERWMDAVVADLDRHYPGISSSIMQREMSTALTMRRFLNTPQGSVYGFAPSVARFARTPSAKTAVEGLFLASAYTGSGGFRGSMMGGLIAAKEAGQYLAQA